MNIKLLIIFIILNVLNVIIQTVKSLVTIKCGKFMAAITNAIAYGLYTVVVVYMVCELPLWLKATIIAAANLIGVYVVKLFEEKRRKTKLWKVETSIKSTHTIEVIDLLNKAKLSYNYIEKVGNYTIFNIYSKTQNESRAIKEILKKYNAKYFVLETETL